MAQVSQGALREVQAALKNYIAEVNATNLAPDSKKTYIQHTRDFVRWLDGGFVPGIRTG